MDQTKLRRYAADGIRQQIALLQQELAELSRPAGKPTNGAARKPMQAAKKSMWTPERRAALSKLMKERAAQKKR